MLADAQVAALLQRLFEAYDESRLRLAASRLQLKLRTVIEQRLPHLWPSQRQQTAYAAVTTAKEQHDHDSDGGDNGGDSGPVESFAGEPPAGLLNRVQRCSCLASPAAGGCC